MTQGKQDKGERGVSTEDPMEPRLFRVVNRTVETKDTFTLELEPRDGEPAPYQPGQFSMIYAFGIGEVPISHSGDPSKAGSYVHTIRSVGAVTQALSRLSPGDSVGIRGPFGSAWPLAAAGGRDLVVMAGGIGLAPLRPVLYAARQNPALFRRVIVLYGARTPDDILFPEELRVLSSVPGLEVHVTVDHSQPGWDGHVGVVTTLLDRFRLTGASVTAMVCGPEVMMRFAADALLHMDVVPDQIYLSMERNMKCAVGHCGHCQYGPFFICKDGPVFPLPRIEQLLRVKEL